MNYTKVNKALAKEFGTGQVELRKGVKGEMWEYTLWFLSDDPTPGTIKKAKKIVARFEQFKWFDNLSFHSD